MKRAIIAAATLLACSQAFAGCKELAAAIDASEKNIADDLVRGSMDRSTETVHLARMTNELLSIQINLHLMERGKCAPLADPVGASGEEYTKAAGACATRGTPPESCDRSTWRRMPFP
jgi:hypothetical protein